MDSITLFDEDNNEVKFDIVDSFGIDEKNYCALQDEDDMILIVELVEEGDEVIFKSIEDQKELDEIIELYEQMKEESHGN